MDLSKVSPEVMQKVKERIKQGEAEGKTSTQMIFEDIAGLGETYGEEIHRLKATVQKMEEKQLDNERRQSTNMLFGGGKRNSSTNSIKTTIADALQQNQEGLVKMYNGSQKELFIETKAVGDMGLGNLTGGTASLNSPVVGPVGMDYRLYHVRDLLRMTTMTGTYLPVLKDNGGEGVPLPVAEHADKPQVDFDLAEAQAKAEVIAAVTVVSKQFLEDVPNAVNWLTDRLTELYFRTENDQLLNGDGISPNIKGINTSGNFTAASTLLTNDIEQIVSGILQLRLLGKRATGIIVNPASLETLLLNKASTSGEYDLPSFVTVSPVGQLMFMGVPVLDINEQPAGKYTIIDNTGSLFAIRQNLRIEFFDQTLAKKNQILIRIESRVAFPVYGATYAIKGTF
jgi:HK97 family phage major capsid protein